MILPRLDAMELLDVPNHQEIMEMLPVDTIKLEAPT